jgi:hypothetical protein
MPTSCKYLDILSKSSTFETAEPSEHNIKVNALARAKHNVKRHAKSKTSHTAHLRLQLKFNSTLKHKVSLEGVMHDTVEIETYFTCC